MAPTLATVLRPERINTDHIQSREMPEITSPTVDRAYGARANGGTQFDEWPGTRTEADPTGIPPARLLPLYKGDLEPREVVIPLQSWEGVVLAVGNGSFLVRLADVLSEHPDEELELATEEISDFDLELLEPGAIFYWTIGYRQRLPHGARDRVSRIRFRRLPAWSEAELAAARERASTLFDDLGW